MSKEAAMWSLEGFSSVQLKYADEAEWINWFPEGFNLFNTIKKNKTKMTEIAYGIQYYTF